MNTKRLSFSGLAEIEDKYKPCKWLSEIFPKRSPYYPQIQDELVYFRQGHNLYVEQVQEKGIYEISEVDLPWKTLANLPAELYVRVTGIKFVLKPPRVAVLTLTITEENSEEFKGKNLSVEFHDVNDVVDFLVHRQLYDKAIVQEWKIGDRFRCLIGNIWWIGTIQSKKPFQEEFPKSKFQCYNVTWDKSEEIEILSPWDMQIIPQGFEIPEEGHVIASDDDISVSSEFYDDQEFMSLGPQCVKFQTILENVMNQESVEISESFKTGLNLNAHPNHAYKVNYFCDLTTVLKRLENGFYRRLAWVKFDIESIAQCIEDCYPKKSDIVKNARIIRDVCLHCLQPQHNQTDTAEIVQIYKTLVKTFSWTDVDDKDNGQVDANLKVDAIHNLASPLALTPRKVFPTGILKNSPTLSLSITEDQRSKRKSDSESSLNSL